MATPPTLPPINKSEWSDRSTTILKKILLIGVLIALLAIPLQMIMSVLSERQSRNRSAVAEITSTWGQPQTFIGPILTIPYRYRYKETEEKRIGDRIEKVEVDKVSREEARFLPLDLKIEGDLKSQVLHRGIYDAVVYTGSLHVSGRFDHPSFEEWNILPTDILMTEAMLSLAISDLRGTREELKVTIGETSFPFTPGSGLGLFSSGVHTRLKGLMVDRDSLAFEMELNLNGSKNIQFAPVGKMTEVILTSPWPDPKFAGSILPVSRDVSEKGFKATWKASYYSRSYPQQWLGFKDNQFFTPQIVENSMFGVELLSLIDSYRLVERSIKYGILFIVFSFTAFFLFEILSTVRIHPFQYTLVGFALCLFFLLLLSFSEFISFGLAYLLGAAASTLLITFYSAGVLSGLHRALIVAALLTVIYGFIYVILQLQDYSLLIGSLGLFAALSVVMFATRRIDWYAETVKK
jgi:inner membrane protein